MFVSVSVHVDVHANVFCSLFFVGLLLLQNEKGLYTSPTLLAGDIDTGRAMLLTGNMEPVAEKKFQVG